MSATWRKHAACRGIDPDVFYPVSDEEADEAKSVCDQCVVREACLGTRWPTGSARGSGWDHRARAPAHPSPAPQVRLTGSPHRRPVGSSRPDPTHPS